MGLGRGVFRSTIPGNIDGWVLLLGVGYENNTSFHLAEHRARVRPEMEQGAPIMEDGQRIWKTFRDIAVDSDPFPIIGRAYEQATGAVAVDLVGSAQCRLFRQRPAVDHALRWFQEHGG